VDVEEDVTQFLEKLFAIVFSCNVLCDGVLHARTLFAEAVL